MFPQSIDRFTKRRKRGVRPSDREVQPHQRSPREAIRLESFRRQFASDSALVQRKTVRIVEMQKPRNGGTHQPPSRRTRLVRYPPGRSAPATERMRTRAAPARAADRRRAIRRMSRRGERLYRRSNSARGSRADVQRRADLDSADAFEGVGSQMPPPASCRCRSRQPRGSDDGDADHAPFQALQNLALEWPRLQVDLEDLRRLRDDGRPQRDQTERRRAQDRTARSPDRPSSSRMRP